MRLKTFRAGVMAEAMERVRAELGPEAIIVSSRLVAGGIELSAALEDEPRELAPPPLDAREALRYHAVPLGLQAALATGPLPEALARFLRFGALPLGAQDPPLMLAGPPGAGKTSTIARLAVRMVLAGTVPMIVTADGYRAAAAEQLAAFTKLLGVSLVVAHTPRALARAMKRRPEGAPVLIDSTGCDALAASGREAVATLAAAAEANVCAVLAGGLDAGEAAEHAAGLSESGARFLIATKLDLTRRVGSVVSAAHAGALCLTDAGVGPGAADGLIPLTPRYLASRLQSWSGAQLA
jgi:flagellar biosynthesis protein FlhF